MLPSHWIAIFSEKVAMQFKIITDKDEFNQGNESF